MNTVSEFEQTSQGLLSMLITGTIYADNPPYLESSHWYMRILRLRDIDKVQNRLESILDERGKDKEQLVLEATRNLFDMYPVFHLANRLDQYQRLVDHADHLAEVHPNRFEVVMKATLRSLRQGEFDSYSEVYEWNVCSDPNLILNQCFTLRHYGCKQPFITIHEDSIKEAERVYGSYDMAGFIERWIQIGGYIPSEYPQYLELYHSST